MKARARPTDVLVIALLALAGCQVSGLSAHLPAGSKPAATATRQPQPPLSLKLVGGFDVSPAHLYAIAPDAALAVGPSLLFIAENDEVRLQDRSGTVIAATTLRKMFAPAGLTPEEGVTDPRAVFDAASGRFFLSATILPYVSCPDRPCPTGSVLAVSTSGAPQRLDPTSWHLYDTPGFLPGASLPGVMMDFDGLAVTADAVLISMNPFTRTAAGTAIGAFSRLRILDKARVLAGEPIPAWVDLDRSKDEAGVEVQGLQPASTTGPADPTFLLGSGFETQPGVGPEVEEPDALSQPLLAASTPASSPGAGQATIGPDAPCRITVSRLTGSPNAPILTTRAVESALGCTHAPWAAQPGGGSPLTVGGIGLSSRPVYRDGHIWLARTVAHVFANGAVAVIVLMELDVSRWPQTPVVVRETMLGSDGVWSFYPALSAGAGGVLVLAYDRSSSSEFPSLYFTGRRKDDPVGRLRSPTLVKAGAAAQHATIGGAGRNRYGDYFDATADPNDGTVWVLAEYLAGVDRRGMWLGHVG